MIEKQKTSKTEPCDAPASMVVHSDVRPLTKHLVDGLSNNFYRRFWILFSAPHYMSL